MHLTLTPKFLQLKKLAVKKSEPVMVLPWPARMWKPQMGEVERSLKKTLPLRVLSAAAAVVVIWICFACQVTMQSMTKSSPLAACVFSAFVPYLFLVAYPKQRKREVRLPFKVEIGLNGIFFKLDERLWVDWSDVESCAFRDSEHPHIKRLELLVRGRVENVMVVFPYDPDEIDETTLCDLFEAHLPEVEDDSVHPIVFDELPWFSKN